MDMSLGKLQESVMDREAGVLRFMGLQRVGHDWATELNWTKTPLYLPNSHKSFWRKPSFLKETDWNKIEWKLIKTPLV